MEIKRKLTSSLMVIGLSLVSTPLIATTINRPLDFVKKETRSWADAMIDSTNSQVIYDDAQNTMVQAIIAINGLDSSDTPTSLAGEINQAGGDTFTVKGTINGVEQSIAYDDSTNIEESAIVKDVDDDTKAMITLNYTEGELIQTISGVQAAVNKAADSDWDWVVLGDGNPIINAIDVSDGTIITQDTSTEVTTFGIEATKATMMLPLQYDDTVIKGGDLSYLVVQESIKNLQIKANDEILENSTPIISDPSVKANVAINANINLINLTEGTTYDNIVVDLDGDWVGTMDDQITLSDFSFQTANDSNGLSGGAIAGIVIGVLVLIALIGAGGYFIYRKENK